MHYAAEYHFHGWYNNTQAGKPMCTDVTLPPSELLPETDDVFVFHPVFQKSMNDWLSENGDATYRLNYELQAGSVVVIVGGYEGQWDEDYALAVLQSCGFFCRVYFFCPYMEENKHAKQRLKSLPGVQIFDVTLGIKDIKKALPGPRPDVVRIKEIGKELKKHNITKVELLALNCQGCEFDLLPHIVSSGLYAKINNIQIQTHCVHELGYTKQKYLDMASAMDEQYSLSWQFLCFFNSWKLKQSSKVQMAIS
jgi:hypothetical protein